MILLPYDDINPTRRSPFFTWLLIGLNVAAFVYLYWVLMPGANIEQVRTLAGRYNGCMTENVYERLSELPTSLRYRTLFFYTFGLVPGNISVSNMQIDKFFTSMFLHGGIGHLLGNMLFLWITGDNLEDRFGHASFLIFYFFCGFAAAGTQVIMKPGACVPMVGASGAIAGVMGAYMVLFPRSKIKVFYFLFFPILGWVLIDAFWWLGLWILFQFLYEYASQDPGGVAHWAHIGGFGMGVLIALFSRITGLVEGGVASDEVREERRRGRNRGRGSDKRW